VPLSFDTPLALLALPLVALPWFARARAAQYHPWLGLLPRDRWSVALAVCVRVLSSSAIALCAIGIAQPVSTSPPSDHVGRGAEIVLLLDRSLSMDQTFGGRTRGGESKGAAARRLLAEFAQHRPQDLLAMQVFTTTPIQVTGFTNRQSVIQAAIAAGNVGHGLADTDVGRALVSALLTFRDQPYNGSRVILLVSDGGAHLGTAVQRRIAELMQREHVALYWLYLRTSQSPGLLATSDLEDTEEDVVPEHFLHRYFSTMGAPYHAYEAENPEALENSIADIDRLQSQPMRYELPGVRHDLTAWVYGLALGCTALLMLAGVWELHAP